MIDLHSHIIPGLDDGAQNLQNSIAMAKQAVDQGIGTIIATPHHRNGVFKNEKDDIIQCVTYLNSQLEKEEIPLKVVPGQETRINGEMVEQLRRGELLPLNQKSGYIFVELPSDHVPRYTNQVLFELQVEGITPVIVHPERNEQIIEDPDKLYDLVRRGTLTQVTAASVTGEFGRKIQTFSHRLIEANLTHFIASDAHNTTTRGCSMFEAYAVIEEKYGREPVSELLNNAQRVMEGRRIVSNPPKHIRKKKKVLGLLKSFA